MNYTNCVYYVLNVKTCTNLRCFETLVIPTANLTFKRYIDVDTKQFHEESYLVLTLNAMRSLVLNRLNTNTVTCI